MCGDETQKPMPLLVWNLSSRKLLYDLRIPQHDFLTNLSAITHNGSYVSVVAKVVFVDLSLQKYFSIKYNLFKIKFLFMLNNILYIYAIYHIIENYKIKNISQKINFCQIVSSGCLSLMLI